MKTRSTNRAHDDEILNAYPIPIFRASTQRASKRESTSGQDVSSAISTSEPGEEVIIYADLEMSVAGQLYMSLTTTNGRVAGEDYAKTTRPPNDARRYTNLLKGLASNCAGVTGESTVDSKQTLDPTKHDWNPNRITLTQPVSFAVNLQRARYKAMREFADYLQSFFEGAFDIYGFDGPDVDRPQILIMVDDVSNEMLRRFSTWNSKRAKLRIPGVVAHSRSRAAERLYAPGGAGFQEARDDFESRAS